MTIRQRLTSTTCNSIDWEYIGVGVVVTSMVGMVAAGVVALVIALNGNSSDTPPTPDVTVPQIEVGGPWRTALSGLQDAGLVGVFVTTRAVRFRRGT